MSNLNELPEVWKEFFDLRKKVNSLGYTTFREVIQNTITDSEIEKLCTDFKQEFKNTPKNDPLYLEVVKLLLDMGIELYSDEEENDEYKELKLPECYDDFNPMDMVEVENNNDKII